MPFTTIKKDRSVDALVDRVMPKLTKKQRDVAIKEVLKANPKIRDVRRLPEGEVIRIPARGKLRTKVEAPATQDPDGAVIKRLASELKGLSARIEEGQKAKITELKVESKQVRSAAFTRAISKSDELQAVAAEAQKAMDVRIEKESKRMEEWQAVLKAAQKDLADRLEKG